MQPCCTKSVVYLGRLRVLLGYFHPRQMFAGKAWSQPLEADNLLHSGWLKALIANVRLG